MRINWQEPTQERKKESDIFLFLPGLLGSDTLHPELHNKISKYRLQIGIVERDDKQIISSAQNIQSAYTQQLFSIIQDIGKSNSQKIHLMGSSFGAWLALLIAQEFGDKITSVLGVSPIIDPHEAASRIQKKLYLHLGNRKQIKLPASGIQTLPSHQSINVRNIPTSLMLGGEDSLQDPSDLNLVQGKNIQTHVISGMEHGEWAQKGNGIIHGFFRDNL